MGKLMINRIGEIKPNKFGSLMAIEKYNNINDIWVRFIGFENLIHTNYREFCKGKIRNPYDRKIIGIGYLGEGEYRTSKNGNVTLQYVVWYNMLKRCYSEIELQKRPSYTGCLVCDEWHNFQNFAKWFDRHYYEIDGEVINLDKDILIKNNKIYSPENCIFVPRRINLLFVRNKRKRGDLPIGVKTNNKNGKYYARWNNGTLGSYNTPKEAFMAYKTFKEKLIKQIAEEYRDKIPLKLYESMLNYKVEIND